MTSAADDFPWQAVSDCQCSACFLETLYDLWLLEIWADLAVG